MEHEKISYPEALKYLANKYNVEIVDIQLTPEEKAKADTRENALSINEKATQFYQNYIGNPEIAKYIRDRHITTELIKDFRIGFARNNWNDLITYCNNNGYKESILIDTSLAGMGEKGAYNFFRNRLMLPFMNLTGNVIGFTGRTIDKSDDIKYLNSRDTLLFQKGKVLFGLYQAKKYIVQYNKCYLVEGNIDVLSLHRANVKHTVCGSGTALTVDQIRMITRFTNNITIVYDGDLPGIKASFKNIDLMLAQGVKVRAVMLPDGEDPDSFVSKQKKLETVSRFLINNEVDFINFKYNFYKKEIEADPIREAELITDLLHSISIIPDEVLKNTYKKTCIEKFNIAEKVVNTALLKVKSAKKELKEVENGFVGMEWAIDDIKKQDSTFITYKKETLLSLWDEEHNNSLLVSGVPERSVLQELNSLTHNVCLADNTDSIYNDEFKLNTEISLCKKLFEFGFNVKCTNNAGDHVSFIDNYFSLCSLIIFNVPISNDVNRKNKVIEDAAELFSKADNTTINISTKKYASNLGLKEIDFRKVMKPFMEKRKTKFSFQNEFIDDNEKLHLDPDHLPEWVDREFLNRWQYFPYQNSKGENVRYVFKTMDGGLQTIGNFYMEPLFHVLDQDPRYNKRVVKINNAEQNKSYYLEIQSDNMIEFAQFKKVLFAVGGNVFTKGKATHHEAIIASIANRFPICEELKIFGQQQEGFWAFANAIYADGELNYMDDLGLVKFKEMMFYSPAFSKIYSGNRQDNDKYENDRFFIYRECNKTTFEEWAGLMNDVYKLNDNGKWATLNAIMCAFRSVIFPIDRLFTSLFIYGPTESGKSQIAISIRSLYLKPDAPLFNLNSGTDAAFFTIFERNRDVPILCEEYNDMQISDIKFQGLKAAVYDGEGKQKRKDATSKDLDISKINGVPVILGQEMPERDDGSLGNRTVSLHVPQKTDWSDDEMILFRKLKDKEKEGLSNILLDILKQRSIVSSNFTRIQRQVFSQLKEDLKSSGVFYQTRVLNTISLFAAVCKLWEMHVPTLKLPFTYDQFYAIARAKLISQSEMISNTNRVSVFFDTIELLLNKDHGIKLGKEFKIEILRNIVIQKNRNETETIDLKSDVKIAFFRLNILHPMYCDIRKTESLKINNLMTYLKDHPAYIGHIKSTRFTWYELEKKFDTVSGRVWDAQKEISMNTSAIAFNYKLLGIDLERQSQNDYSNTFDKIAEPQVGKSQTSIDYSKDDTPF